MKHSHFRKFCQNHWTLLLGSGTHLSIWGICWHWHLPGHLRDLLALASAWPSERTCWALAPAWPSEGSGLSHYQPSEESEGPGTHLALWGICWRWHPPDHPRGPAWPWHLPGHLGDLLGPGTTAAQVQASFSPCFLLCWDQLPQQCGACFMRKRQYHINGGGPFFSVNFRKGG